MIKNIIFDVDGVLINRDTVCTQFLRNNFSKYSGMSDAEIIKNYKCDIPGNYKDLELESAAFKQLSHSSEYFNRPLLDGVIDTLHQLKNMNIRMFTLSAATSPDKKRPVLERIFGTNLLTFEFSATDSKTTGLQNILDKYNLKPAETLFIDDSLMFLYEGVTLGIVPVHSEILFYEPAPDGMLVIHEFKDILKIINE